MHIVTYYFILCYYFIFITKSQNITKKIKMSDWFCENCRFTVFGSKPSCKKCGATRNSSTRTTTTTTSRSTSDWMCKTCNFLVFGSKSECSKCHSKKQDASNLSESQCKLCFGETEDQMALSCGHVICKACLSQVRNCPFCRQRITSSTRLFM